MYPFYERPEIELPYEHMYNTSLINTREEIYENIKRDFRPINPLNPCYDFHKVPKDHRFELNYKIIDIQTKEDAKALRDLESKAKTIHDKPFPKKTKVSTTVF